MFVIVETSKMETWEPQYAEISFHPYTFVVEEMIDLNLPSGGPHHM